MLRNIQIRWYGRILKSNLNDDPESFQTQIIEVKGWENTTIQSTLVNTRSAGLTQLSCISRNLVVIIGQYFFTKLYKTHARTFTRLPYMYIVYRAVHAKGNVC